MKRRMGKKGTMLDIMMVSLVVLFFGIVMIMCLYIADQVFPQLTGYFGGGVGVEVINTVKQGFGTVDYIFMFVYFMLSMVPVLFAALVRHHPIFLILNIIIMIVLFFVFPVISNVMLEFWSTPEFAPYAFGGGGSYTFPIMTRLFQYLPLINMGISVIVMIAMFAKRGGAGGGLS